MPLIKRFFHIPCRGEECFKLLELIREKTPVVEHMDVEMRENGLYITMYGYKTDVKNAWEFIRNLVNTYRSSVVEGKGVRRVKIEYIVSRIKHTFPPKLLNEILERMGYQSLINAESGEIITNAPPELVEDVATRISRIMDNIRFDVRGSSTKYYVTALCILLGKEPREIYELGVSMNHLFRDEDGKYRIRVEWRKALSEFINAYKHEK